MKWIPVSEKLPEEGQEIFVTALSLNKIRYTKISLYFQSFYGDHWVDISSHDIVLAWMPLPEPYEGE